MANSWRCVAVGSFNSGPWDGEIATIGFSGAARDTGAFTGPVINEELLEYGASSIGTSGSSTNMTWSFGSAGIGVWNETNQKAIGEVMYTYLQAIKTYQGTTFSWKEVRVSALEASGAVVNGASVGTITSPVAGGFTQTMPPQLACVASLKTGGRGPRNRGRLYVPAHAPATVTGIVLNSSMQNAVNTATKSAINGFNAITGIRAAVVSKTHSTYSDVTAVRVGDQLDTQRRRREGIKETYITLLM